MWVCPYTPNAVAPPLRRSYSERAVTSLGGAFQTDTNLANHRHRPKLLADCQWRWRWRCGLGRLRNTRGLTETIPRDRRKLIKVMLRKWTFLPPRSHLIRQFVKRHLVTIRREQHVLAQWLRQYFLSRPLRAQCSMSPVSSFIYVRCSSNVVIRQVIAICLIMLGRTVYCSAISDQYCWFHPRRDHSRWDEESASLLRGLGKYSQF